MAEEAEKGGDDCFYKEVVRDVCALGCVSGKSPRKKTATETERVIIVGGVDDVLRLGL